MFVWLGNNRQIRNKILISTKVEDWDISLS